MASCHKSLKFEDASANKRRLFGSRGSGIRQDALFAKETAGPRESDEDLGISATYSKTKNSVWGRRKRRALHNRARTRSKETDEPWMDLTAKLE